MITESMIMFQDPVPALTSPPMDPREKWRPKHLRFGAQHEDQGYFDPACLMPWITPAWQRSHIGAPMPTDLRLVAYAT